MITTDRLPKGFTMRVPTLDDAEAAYEVVHACDMADDGIADHTLEEFRLVWQEPGFNLATDSWCVFSHTGQLVGVADTEHSAFGELYRRGSYKIRLGVDSQNLTGATRLYERAGMHVALQHDTYQKELRAGIERSTQSITV